MPRPQQSRETKQRRRESYQPNRVLNSWPAFSDEAAQSNRENSARESEMMACQNLEFSIAAPREEIELSAIGKQ